MVAGVIWRRPSRLLWVVLVRAEVASGRLGLGRRLILLPVLLVVVVVVVVVLVDER